MSESDEEEQERKRGIRVVDRRRFTAEGELRSDVDEAPEPGPRPAAPPAEPTAARGGAGRASSPATGGGPPPGTAPNEGGRIDFVSFIASLATNAMGALGALPEDYGRGLPQDPDLAREYIDILGMLQEKTRGNLTPAESQAFERLLADVRMAYVEITKSHRGA